MNEFGVFLSKFPDFMNEFMISWFMIDNSRAANYSAYYMICLK